MSAFLELHTKRGWGMGTEAVLDSNKCYGEKQSRKGWGGGEWSSVLYRQALLYCTLLFCTSRCCILYNLKARPSTSKTIMTHFTVVVCSKPAVSPRIEKASLKRWPLKLWKSQILIHVGNGGSVLSTGATDADVLNMSDVLKNSRDTHQCGWSWRARGGQL